MSAPQPPPTPYPPPSAAVRARLFVTRTLWTAIPVATLGFLGWVPAVHIARRRRTRSAWIWLAGLVAALVCEIVMLEVLPTRVQAITGGFTLTCIITATVYAWQGCGDDYPVARRPPYPVYGAGWMPIGYESAPPTPYPAPTQPYSAAMAVPATPAQTIPPVPPVPPAAANDMAAEIQAELRELRGFLGGEDAR